jgi:uncharacterized protein (TIGR02996 family)
MTHQDAFLADILAHPDDDAPRLVYADWLDDHGDEPRAEFIRLQCRLATLAPHEAAWADLDLRARDLLAAHRRAWLPPDLVLQAADGTFRRGFVEDIDIEVGPFLQHGDALLRAAPLRHVRFLPPADPSVVTELVRSPHLGRLPGLYLGRLALREADVGPLVATLASGRPTALELSPPLNADFRGPSNLPE